MAGEWIEEPFPEVIDFQEGPGIMARDFRDEGVPLVRLSGLDRGGSVLSGCNYLDPEMVAGKWAHFALAKGDILLSTSASLGRIAVVGEDAVGAIAYTGIIRMRPRDGRLIAPFIRYLLEGPDFQQQAEMVGVGSVIRHFGPMHLRQMSVRLPPRDEQHAIANILGTLDDKIELNRRMNETLEAMARTLFKSWFIDFDPVRRNIARRTGQNQPSPDAPRHPLPLGEGQGEGSVESLDRLFPDSFEDSELGEIPRGWRIVFLGDICQRVAMGPFGSDIKTDNFVDSGVPIVRGSNLIKGFVEDSFAYISEAKADQLRNANAFPGDIVITHRGTLGQVGLIPERSRFPRYVVSQSQMLISVNGQVVTPRYVYHFLLTPRGQHALLANTSQTGVPAIARPTSSVRAIQLTLPPLKLLFKFNGLVEALHCRRDRNVAENRTLATLRDTLLPKLICGELRVRSACQFATKATL